MTWAEHEHSTKSQCAGMHLQHLQNGIQTLSFLAQAGKEPDAIGNVADTAKHAQS